MKILKSAVMIRELSRKRNSLAATSRCAVLYLRSAKTAPPLCLDIMNSNGEMKIFTKKILPDMILSTNRSALAFNAHL